jgi:glutamate-ammonia-ligase adenylyltransferase
MPQIRDRNTLQALNALCDQSLISRDTCDTLSRSYIFLRDVENKLQMANDAQTHSLPQDENELTVISRTLGYATSENFLHDYKQHTREVNRIFESYFSGLT